MTLQPGTKIIKLRKVPNVSLNQLNYTFMKSLSNGIVYLHAHKSLANWFTNFKLS